ncbi:hypothetical protein C7M52_01159 [Mixta theicola]|nr:hypothetical protein C7M52_01159 [Mixta theicola]
MNPRFGVDFYLGGFEVSAAESAADMRSAPACGGKRPLHKDAVDPSLEALPRHP